MISLKHQADIELMHIRLELANGRAHHFRHFVDQYICYRDGCVTKKGKADTNAALKKNARYSVEAAKIKDAKELVKEHVVPLAVITKELLALGDALSLDMIRHTIDENCIFAMITKDEDKRLRDAGFTCDMPKDYYLTRDKFARYNHAAVKIELVPED